MISIIIPTLNEAENIGLLINDLKKQKDVELEIIVSDGGSDDRTKQICESLDVSFYSSSKGRAMQMNHAVKFATHSVVLFLHADSRILDKSFLKKALKSYHILNKTHSLFACHFQLKFSLSSFYYFHFEEKARSFKRESFNGDQGLLIEKDQFIELGYFDSKMTFLEDQIFSQHFQKNGGKWILLNEVIQTSSRRFEKEGRIKRTLLSALTMALLNLKLFDLIDRIKNIYRDQKSTDDLNLHFVAKESLNYFLEREFSKKYEIFLDIGSYFKQNVWQLAFFIENIFYFYFGIRTRTLSRNVSKLFNKLNYINYFNFIFGVIAFGAFFIFWFFMFFEQKGKKKLD